MQTLVSSNVDILAKGLVRVHVYSIYYMADWSYILKRMATFLQKSIVPFTLVACLSTHLLPFHLPAVHYQMHENANV